MEYIVSYDKNSDRLTGTLLIMLVISLIFNEFTNILIKTDINGIHDSLKYIGNHNIKFIANTINHLIMMGIYIALAASLLLGLRFFHNVLAHFISFGVAAIGLTIMVAASGSLSLMNLTHEYILSKGIESDIIAINGLTIAELRKNAFLIAYSLEGTSIFLFGLYNIITKSIHKIASFSSIIIGVALVISEWLIFETIYFQIIRYFIIINYTILGVLFILKGLKVDKN